MSLKCNKFSAKMLRCHYQSLTTLQTPQGKILVVKGASNNVTPNDFKNLRDYNKITHYNAEKMKSKRSGRDLPFIKIKCDHVKQAEALIWGGGGGGD